jgi:hypothetical protein
MPVETIRQTRPAFIMTAFGLELRLWQESSESHWGAILQDGNQAIYSEFEADNETLAKLDLLTMARDHARLRGDDRDLPILGSLVDCWKSTTIVER